MLPSVRSLKFATNIAVILSERLPRISRQTESKDLQLFFNEFRLHHNSPSPNRDLKGHDFRGCRETRSGGRRGFQPPHKADGIKTGFRPGETFLGNFTGNSDFFRSLFNFRIRLSVLYRLACLALLAPLALAAQDTTFRMDVKLVN